jgi:hypothetical protein
MLVLLIQDQAKLSVPASTLMPVTLVGSAIRDSPMR